jgi:tRNA pseudouridine55 synthase
VIGSWDGLLPIDKPSGPTSHDIVARVRSATGSRRVGHTGTLDPAATGLLLLVLGRATRLARFLPSAPKTYRGVLTLGVTTTTDDLTGDVVSRHDGPLPGPDAVRATAASHIGRQWQVPPAFSARQVGGTRLYRLARKGVAATAPAAEIVVESLSLSPTDAPERWVYDMVVSPGTYVRAIVRDIGVRLGCGATVASLRRTTIGPFHVDRALRLPSDLRLNLDAVRSHLVPIDEMPLGLTSIVVPSREDATRFAAGGAVALDPESLDGPPLAAVRDPAGRLIGVGHRSRGTVTPRMVLADRS